jgi:hypothetical protein
MQVGRLWPSSQQPLPIIELNPYIFHPVTKKTHEAPAISFSTLFIYRVFCLPEVGKNPVNPRFSWLLLPSSATDANREKSFRPKYMARFC